MKKSLALATLLALFLSACTPSSQPEGLQLYFPTSSYLEGSALGSESAGIDPQDATVDTLITALLSGPEDPDLTTPFPKGVALRSWYAEEGILHINLSEPYGGLSGISLTLADYSIALTLCQLDEVSGVSITVENDPIPFRYRQVLTPDDILLTDLLQASE